MELWSQIDMDLNSSSIIYQLCFKFPSFLQFTICIMGPIPHRFVLRIK